MKDTIFDAVRAVKNIREGIFDQLQSSFLPIVSPRGLVRRFWDFPPKYREPFRKFLVPFLVPTFCLQCCSD